MSEDRNQWSFGAWFLVLIKWYQVMVSLILSQPIDNVSGFRNLSVICSPFKGRFPKTPLQRFPKTPTPLGSVEITAELHQMVMWLLDYAFFALRWLQQLSFLHSKMPDILYIFPQDARRDKINNSLASWRKIYKMFGDTCFDLQLHSICSFLLNQRSLVLIC